MVFDKKIFFSWYICLLTFSLYAMEIELDRRDSSLITVPKIPKLLQDLCLDSYYKTFLQGCDKKEDIAVMLQELKRLNIPDVFDQKMAMRLLGLSNCTLKLLPDKIIAKRIGGSKKIITVYAAQFYPLTNSLACAYKKKKKCFLGFWSLAKTDKEFYPCETQNKFSCIGFSKEADYIVSSDCGRDDSIIEVWNTALVMDSRSEFFVCNFEIKDLYFSTNSKYIIAVLKDGRRLWNWASKEEIKDESAFSSFDVKENMFDNESARARMECVMEQLSLSQSSIRVVHTQRSNKKINFVTRSGRLITLKSTKNKLDALVQNCSLETAAQLIHLSEFEAEKRCLSCKKINLPEEIKKLLVHKSAVISTCDLCKESIVEFNKEY